MKERLRKLLHPKISFFVLGLVGIGDATYVTANALVGKSDICVVSKGCDVVLSSQYSTLLGLPVSLWGLLYYLLFFLGILAYHLTHKRVIISILALFSTIGFLMSLYFVYLMIFVIQALCEFCILSATTSTLLFVISIIWLYRNHRKGGILKTSSQKTIEYSYDR